MSRTFHSSLSGYEFTPPPPAEISAQITGFEVDKILGVGGMGVVYRGWQQSLHRHVAIKLLPAELEAVEGLAERFESEARAMARLNHGNIAGVFDIDRTTEGHSYFVMEYVDGGTLHERLQRGQMSTEDIVNLLSQVCDGLRYAHDRGVVHRDMKPNNILINTEGKAKVVDFGLAQVGDAIDVGQSVGTPAYMAPELFEENVQVDGRADIYAVGVMLYEMLTGDRPRGEFRPPSEVSPGIHSDFDRIVTRAMQRRAVNRQQTALEFRQQLQGAGNQNPPPLQNASPPAAADSSGAPGSPVVGRSKPMRMGAGTMLESNESAQPTRSPRSAPRSRAGQRTQRPRRDILGIPEWWPMLLVGIFLVVGMIALGIWFIEK
ncbi:MAG: serine/threonine protein kinase [Verrucomicrobiales bacterium]|jgi:serine/threonine protein kinase